MQIISDKKQISEDVFDFMISYLPFPQKSICSKLAKLFSPSVYNLFQLIKWLLMRISLTEIGYRAPNSVEQEQTARLCSLTLLYTIHKIIVW